MNITPYRRTEKTNNLDLVDIINTSIYRGVWEASMAETVLTVFSFHRRCRCKGSRNKPLKRLLGDGRHIDTPLKQGVNEIGYAGYRYLLLNLDSSRQGVNKIGYAGDRHLLLTP